MDLHLLELHSKILPDILENVAPLHLAVLVNNVDAVKILLEPHLDSKTPVCVNQRIKGCDLTALHLAVLLKRRSLISELLAAGADLISIRDANGFSAFELAVELDNGLARVLYDDFYASRTSKYSFLYEYLVTEVKEKALVALLAFGENFNYAPDMEDSTFVRLLRCYRYKNAVGIISFFIRNINLPEEERKLLTGSLRPIAARSVPSLFNNYSFLGQPRDQSICQKKGYNSLGVVIMFCPRESSERIEIMQTLIDHGSKIDHLTKKGRSLLHLCAKSKLSCIDEAYFLIKKGVQVMWTDLRQAIKYSRLDFLDMLLRFCNPQRLRLRETFPYAMSMLVFKSVPDRISASHKLSKEDLQQLLIRFFEIFINEHDLDPSTDGRFVTHNGRRVWDEFYPLPLLYLLIWKNSIYSDFYEPIIEFVIKQPSIRLDYSVPGHGTPHQYASALKQFSVVSMLIDKMNQTDSVEFRGPVPRNRLRSSIELLEGDEAPSPSPHAKCRHPLLSTSPYKPLKQSSSYESENQRFDTENEFSGSSADSGRGYDNLLCTIEEDEYLHMVTRDCNGSREDRPNKDTFFFAWYDIPDKE